MHGGTLYNLHKRVIDSYHKNVTGALQLLVVDVAGDVRVGARWAYEGLEFDFCYRQIHSLLTKSRWNTNDQSLSFNCFA
jgi:hypothetical protein